MEFRELLALVHGEPLFESALLLAGDVRPQAVHRQLSRWVRAGRVVQLRRGLYMLAPEYRSQTPHPFLVANQLDHASYVSLQSALAHHGLLPEFVATTTSVTTRRPRTWQTAAGRFSYRHLKDSAFFGYHTVPVMPTQHARVASPEKALVDLLYLTPGSDEPAYLRELRLGHLSELDLRAAARIATRVQSARALRAVHALERMVDG
jgi:predicted transcriptional regulator of viral defense system